MSYQAPDLAEDHVPGKRFYTVFALVTTALLLVGFYVSFTHEWNDNENATVWLWLLGFLLFGGVGPYAIQYAILRRFGVRCPRRRKWDSNWALLIPHLVYWWEIGDYKLTGRRFAVAYGTPALLVCAMVLAYVIRFPSSGVIIGILPAYLGNFWFALLAIRRPEGTLAENSERGVRFYETAT